VIVIGGGIVGLATARALLANDPALSVVVVEKEDRWAAHQTSRNSGVIHSGIYYTPGSAKAAMCGAGAASMIEFAESHGLPFRRCGKLIVATDPEELPRLDRLHERAVANGVTISRMTQDEAREIEPHVRCLAALHAPNTSITDFAAVCGALAEELKLAGADLRT
jgi:L-2-hydroxyglutarate oxidase